MSTEETPQFDEDRVLAVAVLVAAILVQFSIPFILYCCAFCMKTLKTCIEAKQQRRSQRDLEGEIDRCYSETETAAKSKSDEEFAKCVQHYYGAVDRRDEALKIKHRKGFYRNVALVRLISLVAYVSFYVWIAAFIGCEMSDCSKYGLSWSYLRIFGFVMLGVTPIIVLIESAFSHELDYILNILEGQSACRSFIQEMHPMFPEITMTIKCFHFENRSSSNYSSEGGIDSNTESDLVVTFKQDYPFTYRYVVDASDKELPRLTPGRLTRVKVEPHILFGDSKTRKEFAEQKERLVAINQHRDEKVTISVKMEIPGLDKRFCAYDDHAAKSWWICPRYFWLATALFMTWPYRWVFRAMTPKVHYPLIKKIYTRNTPPREESRDDDVIDDILRRHGRVLPDLELVRNKSEDLTSVFVVA